MNLGYIARQIIIHMIRFTLKFKQTYTQLSPSLLNTDRNPAIEPGKRPLSAHIYGAEGRGWPPTPSRPFVRSSRCSIISLSSHSSWRSPLVHANTRCRRIHSEKQLIDTTEKTRKNISDIFYWFRSSYNTVFFISACNFHETTRNIRVLSVLHYYLISDLLSRA